MFAFCYQITFFLLSIYILVKCISYGFYEINSEKNKFGGYLVIVVNLFIVIFANIIVWHN